METMKYYGLMGIQRPIDYTSIYGNLYNDYCPQIENSCCDLVDFQTIHKLWQVKTIEI